jgi:hypothetical protein
MSKSEGRLPIATIQEKKTMTHEYYAKQTYMSRIQKENFMEGAVAQ